MLGVIITTQRRRIEYVLTICLAFVQMDQIVNLLMSRVSSSHRTSHWWNWQIFLKRRTGLTRQCIISGNEHQIWCFTMSQERIKSFVTSVEVRDTSRHIARRRRSQRMIWLRFRSWIQTAKDNLRRQCALVVDRRVTMPQIVLSRPRNRRISSISYLSSLLWIGKKH